MKTELIRQYAEDNNLDLAEVEHIIRRSDPLDTAAGAHIPAQGDVSLFVDQKNGIVYKVGTEDKLKKNTQDYHTLITAKEAGVTVPQPIATPKLYDDYFVYASQFVPHDPHGSPSPEATGTELAALHSIVAEDFRPAISKLQILAEYVLASCEIDRATQKSIEQRCMPCIKTVTHDMATHDTLIHGDIHLGNVLPTTPKPTLIDFEDSGRGSPLWDLAVLVQSATRFGLDPAWVKRCLDSWQRESDQNIEPELLTAYTEWRYWYGALSAMKRIKQGEELEDELQTRLRWVHDPNDTSKWNRC